MTTTCPLVSTGRRQAQLPPADPARVRIGFFVWDLLLSAITLGSSNKVWAAHSLTDSSRKNLRLHRAVGSGFLVMLKDFPLCP